MDKHSHAVATNHKILGITLGNSLSSSTGSDVSNVGEIKEPRNNIIASSSSGNSFHLAVKKDVCTHCTVKKDHSIFTNKLSIPNHNEIELPNTPRISYCIAFPPGDPDNDGATDTHHVGISHNHGRVG